MKNEGIKRNMSKSSWILELHLENKTFIIIWSVKAEIMKKIKD